MTRLDVAIIGAGAAGTSAAFHLAKAGKKVALLEKLNDNKIKPCGGGMASSVQNLFPFDLKQAVDEVITNVEFTWYLSDKVTAELPGSAPFWIVRREKLDSLIRNHAINEGSEILKPFNVNSLQRIDNHHWIISSSEGMTVEAKTIVVADGSSSPWPKRLGLGPPNQHHATTISVRLEGKGNLEKGTARFEFGLVKHGFAWAFPLNNGVNVGVGTFIGKQTVNCHSILEEFLPNIGFNPKDGERTSKNLRVWNGHYPLHSKGILAVGDAASLCDPFLAEGLRPAILSGCEAAHAITHWLDGDIKSLNSYTKTMRLKWGDSMAWGRRIAHVFYRFPSVGYQLGIKRPTAPQRIAEILSGKMGYGDIAQRVIRRLLFQNS